MSEKASPVARTGSPRNPAARDPQGVVAEILLGPAAIHHRKSDDPALEPLDDGEKSALTLGMTLGADLILIDDRKGAAVALQKGFEITGTLGLLTRSAQRGILDLGDALARLKRTNFQYRQELFDDLLKKYGESGKG